MPTAVGINIVRQKMNKEPLSFPTKEFRVADAKNDILTGKLITVGCLLGAILVVLVPAREGASPGGKLFLIGLALSGVGKGLSMVSRAKRRFEKAKEEPNQPLQPTAASRRG
jgi:hypothetical protein